MARSGVEWHWPNGRVSLRSRHRRSGEGLHRLVGRRKAPLPVQTVPQILFCAACGGFAFAGIENLIYLYVYVPEHTLAFLKFRWTVCVGLHVACSLVAGVGLARIWDNAIRNRQRPKLAWASLGSSSQSQAMASTICRFP